VKGGRGGFYRVAKTDFGRVGWGFWEAQVEDTVARRARAACTVHRAAWAAGMKATLRLRGFDTGSMARQSNGDSTQ
jgi:hypothetical protein